MEVSFRANRFVNVFLMTEGPALEMPFMLDANIPIDISCLFKFNISGSGDISVYNFGDRPVRPIVKLGASARKYNAVYERKIACVLCQTVRQRLILKNKMSKIQAKIYWCRVSFLNFRREETNFIS